MVNYTEGFKSLVTSYRDMQIEFPNLKAITIAQWINESGRGDSNLARNHNNYAGLKWRDEMQGIATPVVYAAHDGTERYCAFASNEDFVVGYWRFLDRAPYAGWRDHTGTPEEFIGFIGPIYTPTKSYPANVKANLQEAEGSLAADIPAGGAHHHIDHAHGTSEHPPKPPIKQFIQSPHHSSRNGERIRWVIMHYTTSRNVHGTIEHFLDPATKVSAHYVIARNGDLYQMVRDSEKAWHAKNANADSIGIEHSAEQGDQMTAEQTLSSVALVRWLLSEYKLPKTAIHGHKYTPENAGTTDCPHELFGDDSGLALQQWVQANI
jgi:hypothetical protein